MHPIASRALFEDDVRHLSPALERRREWRVHLVEYPLIDCSFTAAGRTPLRLRLMCDDWNDLPPAIGLHDADGTPLQSLLPNPTGVFNGSAHPATGLPFVCMRGARSKQHTVDLGSYRLPIGRDELVVLQSTVENCQRRCVRAALGHCRSLRRKRRDKRADSCERACRLPLDRSLGIPGVMREDRGAVEAEVQPPTIVDRV